MLLEVNITRSPVTPTRSDSISSAGLEQSMPQPSSANSDRIAGVGVALTAKYSRNPGFQSNAAFSRRAFSRIERSS